MAIAKDLKKSAAGKCEEIRKIVKTCNELCGLKSNPLSLAAKLLFMLKEKPENERKMTYEEAKGRAKSLGWNINDKDIEQGVSILERLKLAKIERH